MKDTPSKTRLWIAILSGTIGLFLVIGAPLLAIGVLFFINLPAFKQALIGERSSDNVEESSIEEETGVGQVVPAT